MIRLTSFKGNYNELEKDSYADFMIKVDDRLIPLGYTKEMIGKSEDGAYDIYGYKYGDFNKPTVFIQSNIHGTEWKTAYYVLDFFEKLVSLDFYDKEAVEALRDSFSWYYIPSINPYGFDNSTYYNVNGVNLNRNYDIRWEQYGGDAQWEGNNYKGTAVWSESEARISRDKILEIKPHLFVDCHTSGASGSGVDDQHRSREHRIMMLDVLESSKVSCKGSKTSRWRTQFSPQAGAWASVQDSKEGQKTISTVFEANSLTDDFNYGLTTLFILCFTVLNKYKNNRLKLTSLSEIK